MVIANKTISSPQHITLSSCYYAVTSVNQSTWRTTGATTPLATKSLMFKNALMSDVLLHNNPTLCGTDRETLVS